MKLRKFRMAFDRWQKEGITNLSPCYFKFIFLHRIILHFNVQGHFMTFCFLDRGIKSFLPYFIKASTYILYMVWCQNVITLDNHRLVSHVFWEILLDPFLIFQELEQKKSDFFNSTTPFMKEDFDYRRSIRSP